jgi:glutathione-regulated potassium-efflux system ancillary protein KefF
MALMILAHPDISASIANKTISERVKEYHPELEIRNIFEQSKNYHFDVKNEQEALLRHELIILQFPMYWYNMPAILKGWIDQVFTYQFAYGSNGNKLRGKFLMPSITIGQSKENFENKGVSIIDSLLLPLKKTAEYSGMKYLQPELLFDISTVTGHSHEEIQTAAQAHSAKITSIISKFSDH